MTIYEELLLRVKQGKEFSINFEKRNMKVGKRWLIREGDWDKEKILYPVLEGEPLQVIEEYYKEYKYSCPSEKSERKRKLYFKPLSVDELTDEQMVTGINREYARAKLEGFVLCMILEGNIPWKEGAWFWQSKNEPELILLKKWIGGTKNE